MKLKQQDETIKYVIEVLEKEVKNYSQEFAPERVIKLREYIKSLKGA
jgi:excinuclease UvrABC helicase subunit UvrB